MIAIPVQISPTQYNLAILLEAVSLDRIRAYDPAVIETDKFPGPVEWSTMHIKEIVLFHANAEEMKQAQSIGSDYNVLLQFLNHLSRGFQNRPDLGDHDTDEYQKLGQN